MGSNDARLDVVTALPQITEPLPEVNAESWPGFEQRIQERRLRALTDTIRNGLEAVRSTQAALEEARVLCPGNRDIAELESLAHDAMKSFPERRRSLVPTVVVITAALIAGSAGATALWESRTSTPLTTAAPATVVEPDRSVVENSAADIVETIASERADATSDSRPASLRESATGTTGTIARAPTPVPTATEPTLNQPPKEPTSTVSVNATPWAEVWIDGMQVGETPIGDLVQSVGDHQVEFRHPTLGVKRTTVHVTENEPVRVSVDMNEP